MSSVSMIRRWGIPPLIAAGLVFGVACFSERSETTAPPSDARCDVPLTPDLLGATVVAIRDFSFQPAELTVKPGSRVVWVNCDPAGSEAHTSTSDDELWDSPLLQPGATYTRTFDQAGTFAYHCEPHPFMTGTVVVEP